uniref:Uncharacterized protein n=1 Tax=Heterorhabditis bacteriophora TaxID=37862 RepID=A0A1I7WY45_HETBA
MFAIVGFVVRVTTVELKAMY